MGVFSDMGVLGRSGPASSCGWEVDGGSGAGGRWERTTGLADLKRRLDFLQNVVEVFEDFLFLVLIQHQT